MRWTLNLADVAELEQRLDAQGTSLSLLMANAGAALAEAAREHSPKPCKVVLLCGSGNNAGDGWVAAALLHEAGYDVTVVAAKSPQELKAEPARSAALQACKELPEQSVLVRPSADGLAGALAGARLAIDALLGTGFAHDAVREPLASWIDALGAERAAGGLFVIAADVPSGVNAQTGVAAQPHVQADATITMMVSKPGLEGNAACGRLHVASICSLEPQQAFLDERCTSRSLNGEQALQRLEEGNRRYVGSGFSAGSGEVLRRKGSLCGQYPFAVIVCCSDSRVVPELLFDAALGDLFVIRVAGNVMDNHQLGSIEYAVEHLGAKLVVVLGHTQCGAVAAALGQDPDGAIAYIVSEIRDGIGEETDPERASVLNACHSVARIEESQRMRDDESYLGVKVVPALFHIDTGLVDFVEQAPVR